MRPFTDYETTPEFTVSEKLPAGAYVVKIRRAEESDGALCILFDIAEGEFKNYFMDKFRSDKENFPETARYKGVYRLWYPSGKEYDETNKRRMKTVLKLIKEESYLTQKIEREGTVTPKALNNWRFIPDAWARPALARDRKLIFKE